MKTNPVPLAVFVILLCLGTTAANACSLDEFDRGSPPGVVDKSPATDRTHFEWGTDVDSQEVGARGWHYIRNLDDKNLSLYWKKPDLLISFDRPLPKDHVACKYDYGDAENYSLDSNAPIKTSNDGMKSAEAYVQKAAQPSLTGAAIDTDYVDGNGNIVNAFAKIILRYFAGDRVLQLTIDSGPANITIGLGANALGMDAEKAAESLQSKDFKPMRISSLTEIVGQANLAMLDPSTDQSLVLLAATRQRTVNFAQLDTPPTGTASMLLIDSSGALIAATNINLDPLSGSGRN